MSTSTQVVKQPLSVFERVFINTSEMVQLAVKVADPQYIPLVVKNFGKTLIGLNLKTDGKSLIHKNSFPIYGLPRNITNVDDACDFVASNKRMNNLYESLGSVAISDDIVAMTCSHLCTDGLSMMNTVKRCLDNNVESPPLLPRSVELVFADKVKDSDCSIMEKNLQKISRYPKGPKPDTYNPESVMCKITRNYIPFKDLICYDKKREAPKGITDSLWLAFALAVESKKEKAEYIGTYNCINLRPYMDQNDIDASIGNCFTSFVVYADDIRQELTLNQIMKQIRTNFENDMKNGIIYPAIKGMFNGYAGLSDDLFICDSSHMGMFPVRYPLVDVSLRNCMKSQPAEGSQSLMTFSKKVEGVGKLCTLIQSAPTQTSDASAKMMSDTLLYILTQIPLETKLGDAIQQIHKFQAQNYTAQ